MDRRFCIAWVVLFVAWMAGRWEGRDAKGLEMEEVWLEPKGGTMLGLHRDVAGGKAVSFEFLRIALEAEGLTYWASPRGRPTGLARRPSGRGASARSRCSSCSRT